MRYFTVNVMPMDTAFAFTKEEPSGFKDHSYKLGEGEEVAPADGYPKDGHVRMDDDFGRELGGIIGNTQSLMIVSRPMKEAIEKANAPRTQFLPLTILNHKRRVASADYFIVNPLGTLDCADLGASDIEFDGSDVVAVESLVLAEAKLGGAPDLFRVREDPSIYVVSQALLKAWIELKPRPKNVYVDELTVTPAAAAAVRPKTGAAGKKP